ncbi:hypothetical protein [Caldimonas mangrovi]|nr:hypothetical protein [Caldimonas mangrovi]
MDHFELPGPRGVRVDRAVAPGAVMAAFAADSAVSLHFGPALWRRWRASGQAVSGAWAVRLAGAALAGASIWAIGQGLGTQHSAGDLLSTAQTLAGARFSASQVTAWLT